MAFIPRFVTPLDGNPYYNTISNGGYSTCRIGNKKTGIWRQGLDTLPNCVAEAQGRFNESGLYNAFKYAIPGNAEDMYAYAQSMGLSVGQEPKLGAIICWSKGKTWDASDGEGHVAFVERVISSTEIIVSESGWNSSRLFWTATHKKGDGSWTAGTDANWMSGRYSFLGFIYNPAVKSNNEKAVSVDGSWGPGTTRALQRLFETTEDGIISGQRTSNKKYAPAASTASWQYSTNGTKYGSSVVRKLQELIGVTIDGSFGPATAEALQIFLKNLGYYKGAIDRSVGKETVKALQKYINYRFDNIK